MVNGALIETITPKNRIVGKTVAAPRLSRGDLSFISRHGIRAPLGSDSPRYRTDSSQPRKRNPDHGQQSGAGGSGSCRSHPTNSRPAGSGSYDTGKRMAERCT